MGGSAETKTENPALARFNKEQIETYVRQLQSVETTLLASLKSIFKDKGWLELDITNLEKRLGGDRIHNFNADVFNILTERVTRLRQLHLSLDEIIALVGLLPAYRAKMKTEGLTFDDWMWLYNKSLALEEKTY